MSTSEREVLEGVRILTPEEAVQAFDEAVRSYLDMSGDEFIRRWYAGEFAAIADKPGYRHLMYLAGIIPFAGDRGTNAPDDTEESLSDAETSRQIGGVTWLTAQQEWDVFDYQARKLLNISGDEFLRQWNAGELRSVADAPGHWQIMLVASFIPHGCTST